METEGCLACVAVQGEVIVSQVPLYQPGGIYEAWVHGKFRLMPEGTRADAYFDGQSISTDPSHGRKIGTAYIPRR